MPTKPASKPDVLWLLVMAGLALLWGAWRVVEGIVEMLKGGRP